MQNQITPEQYMKTPTALRRTMLQMAETVGRQQAVDIYNIALPLETDPELRTLIETKLNELNGEGFVPTPPVVVQGGEGQIMSKAELMAIPNLFLIKKGNWNYLEGKSAQLSNGRWWMAIASVVFIAATGYSVFIGTKRVPLFATVIIGLMAVAFSAFTVINFRKSAKLESEGRLLKGQLTHIWGHWDTTRNSNGSTSRSYKVSVTAAVNKPDGTILTATAEETRNDLGRSSLPIAGTPIAVMYVDDTTYEIL